MPPHTCISGECEHFRYLAWAWCITQIRQLLDGRDVEPVTVNIAPLDGEIGINLPPNRIAIGVTVDREHAATVDITKPVYVAELFHPTRPDESLGLRIIDGWHRVYRARTEGLDTLPAIRIPDDIERAARLPVLIR